VLFAGTTVVIAILGLFLAGLPAISGMGAAVALVVAVSMAAAVTLLPGLLGLAGTKIDRLSIHRKARVAKSADETVAGRWAHHVGNHPVRYVTVGLGVLCAIAVPALSMRIGVPDDGNAPTRTTQPCLASRRIKCCPTKPEPPKTVIRRPVLVMGCDPCVSGGGEAEELSRFHGRAKTRNGADRALVGATGIDGRAVLDAPCFEQVRPAANRELAVCDAHGGLTAIGHGLRPARRQQPRGENAGNNRLYRGEPRRRWLGGNPPRRPEIPRAASCQFPETGD
jgi:hypothetical protein